MKAQKDSALSAGTDWARNPDKLGFDGLIQPEYTHSRKIVQARRWAVWICRAIEAKALDFLLSRLKERHIGNVDRRSHIIVDCALDLWEHLGKVRHG